MKDEIRKVKKDNLYKLIGDELKRYIIKNKLKEGDRLPGEYELAELLGVSRATVREGIRHLDSLGIISTGVKTGIIVKGLNIKPFADYLMFNIDYNGINIGELIEARKMIELDAIELAVKNARKEDLEAIFKTIEGMENRIKQKQNIIEYDLEFHKNILIATRNMVIDQFTGILVEYFQKSFERGSDINYVSDVITLEEHKEIYNSLCVKDLKKALSVMDVHISRKLQEYITQLSI